ncbi:MAG: hypothetical protein Q6J78_00820 [Thermostichales cyanobacterium SRBZ-1_bins_19]
MAIMDLNSLQNLLRRLSKGSQKLKSAQQTWDLVAGEASLKQLHQDLQTLCQDWLPTHQSLQEQWHQLRQQLQDPDYARRLEAALSESGIPWQGQFPSYELTPLKLAINLGTLTASLNFGRRQWQKTTALEPQRLSKWVGDHYQALVKRSFPRDRFCQELLSAYGLLNRLNNQSTDVKWGQSVSLKAIYELLTLRTVTRQDYSLVLFSYDLSQLRQQEQIRYQSYQLELAALRDPGANLVLINRQGQEERVGIFPIYALDTSAQTA